MLSDGHQLLTPSTPQDGTIAADWVSHPRGDKTLALVVADRFAAHLRELTSPAPAKTSVS
ncbi:hypothetical protein QF027_009785 [Streptomyces canus]|nr:hypothetical protein [Streptomyces canus]